jgi:hypothetical protein
LHLRTHQVRQRIAVWEPQTPNPTKLRRWLEVRRQAFVLVGLAINDYGGPPSAYKIRAPVMPLTSLITFANRHRHYF